MIARCGAEQLDQEWPVREMEKTEQHTCQGGRVQFRLGHVTLEMSVRHVTEDME